MLPRVITFTAVSLDGRIDGFEPDVAQYYRLAPAWEEDATLAGSDTILAAPLEAPPEDDSSFQPPPVDPQDRRPLLVIADSRGRVRTWHAWRQTPYWRDVLALVSQATPAEYLAYLRQRRIRYLVAGTERVDFRAALEQLHERDGVRTVRVDSGGTLSGVLLRAGLVHEVSVLVHPVLAGGAVPRSFFRPPSPAETDPPLALRLMRVRKLPGDLLWLRYEVLQ
jgi:2,5-diamino-6-(ribosylamino)-4(3H)-pyrimidinone 5'-phosphate reductase